MPTVNLIGGWVGMLAGVLTGAFIGLFFHQDGWMGGYSSYPRRLTRLGHISFFGLGFLNLIFAATAGQLLLSGYYLQVASWALVASAPSPCRQFASFPLGVSPCGVSSQSRSFPSPSVFWRSSSDGGADETGTHRHERRSRAQPRTDRAWAHPSRLCGTQQSHRFSSQSGVAHAGRPDPSRNRNALPRGPGLEGCRRRSRGI